MNTKRIFKKTLTLISIGLILYGCQSSESKTNGDASAKSELPSDISYNIISKEPNNALSKSTIYVRLDKEVSKDILQKMAFEIKADNKGFDKLWIFYFLPEMNTSSGAWAISHFKPDLELEIIGASKAASDEMNNRKVTGEILDTWIDNDPIAPNTKYLVKENNKLFMKSVYAKTKYANATDLVEELTKITFRGLIRYDYPNNHGEYYLIEKNGNLGQYSSDGKFREVKKKQ